MKHKKNSNGIFYNWQIKCLCLLFAVLVYFTLSYSMSGERSVTLPLKVELPKDLSVTSLIPETADVVIRGDERQIYMVDLNRVTLSADFSGVTDTGIAAVPVKIDYSDLLDYIDITDVTLYTRPSVVKLYFE